MGIFDRLSRLIRANVNDLVDRAEDPEKVLDQVLREMQTNIQTARAQVIAMIAQEKELEADRNQVRTLATEWDRKARAAVGAGKDDLAREALRRKRDNETNAGIYEEQLATQRQVVAKLKEQLRQLEAKYQTTLSQREMLIARGRRAKAQQKVAESISVFTPSDPSNELERMERQIRSGEARAAALTELAGESLDSQFAALSNSEIEDELAALKRGAGPALSTGPAATRPRPSAEDFRELDEFDIDRELEGLKRD